MESIENYWEDNSAVVSFTALFDIGQPYSCTQWGNVNQNDIPIIINDGNGFGNHFFNWFETGSAVPSFVFIDHTMTVYYKSNYMSLGTANNKINQMLNNCGALCDDEPDVFGCTDEDAQNYNPDANVDDGSCNFGMELSFGTITTGAIDINLSNLLPISGFQFNLNVNESENLIILEANGGLAEMSGYSVSTSEMGVVLGFSFDGTEIPSGDHHLTTIYFDSDYYFESEICFESGILSDSNGDEIPVDLGDCIIYDEPLLLGDINQDGVINVLDVVLMVNFALGMTIPSNSEFLSADFNQDGIINVLDIVQLVNTILAES